MPIFSNFSEKIVSWSHHPHAPYYLMGWSFIESSVFPVPPDVMMISLSLAKPNKVWRYAALTTLFSVLGGILGYCLGYYFFQLIHPYIVQFGYLKSYQTVSLWFNTWGFWVMFFAGITPIPYKLFTIGAGATHMVFLPFVLASIVGRSLRFFLVSAIMFYGGERLRTGFLRIIDLGAILLLPFILILIILHYAHVI